MTYISGWLTEYKAMQFLELTKHFGDEGVCKSHVNVMNLKEVLRICKCGSCNRRSQDAIVERVFIRRLCAADPYLSFHTRPITSWFTRSIL